ncbi:DUF4258 domain-containing protein [Patescibacteria group bacterium]|nr:DUF4258 domain-containing protein [Patescibacteria group bacterium]
MKVVFSKHAKERKFPALAKHGFNLTESDVLKVVENPEHEDKDSDVPNIIASKSFGEKLVLRVVYKKQNDIIKIITFYPAEKGRYY